MKLNLYQKTAITTVFATLFLIFVGGLVRASGAGLGCPDWPRCFGNWIPPLSASDLPSQFDPSQFNVLKTWTEYINRLVGVTIGLLITATFVLSFRYRKTQPPIFYSSFAAFILVIFQGWLGGQVVKTGLSVWIISIHMILALLIVNFLMYAAFKATSDFIKIDIIERLRKKLYWVGILLLVLTTIQLVIGTQVREEIDVLKEAVFLTPRSTWLVKVGDVFKVHRTYSWVILVSGIYLAFIIWKEKAGGMLRKLGYGNLLLIVLQIAIGVGLQYLDIPPVLQVFHLVGVSLMVCTQFLFLLTLRLRTQ